MRKNNNDTEDVYSDNYGRVRKKPTLHTDCKLSRGQIQDSKISLGKWTLLGGFPLLFSPTQFFIVKRTGFNSQPFVMNPLTTPPHRYTTSPLHGTEQSKNDVFTTQCCFGLVIVQTGFWSFQNAVWYNSFVTATKF